MIVATECALCGREDIAAYGFNEDGLCRNPSSPDDHRPRINACEDLVAHLSSALSLRGRARLRTKQRTEQDARRLLAYASRKSGVGVEFEVGKTWVEAISNGERETAEVRELAPKKVAHGFVIDELDIGKMHLDLIEAKRRAALYSQMAQIEEGYREAAAEAWADTRRLKELIEAWEEQHGEGQTD